ncbi:DNA repair protein RecO [Roseiconus lacunae]|uniref:DNA repair protein RecO n=1 Tax=Roseiconus lacunae TaxID=2605694 RepID=A0ABT7PQ28_9BACT|nr:DNA repair protein RecO [Roseiconus lacunae]MCD0461901.1 DNA repair protein RecO [Roseiconus lacunae]MDM4018612.1 DNA repair protein RecO [Roseiconus lacunae]WRQ52666.1 DNA repair protein RecO [Stieleria sp. HD01]
MAAELTTAIVLRTIEFSETSLVVHLLTRDFGQLAALAKGARRPKSSFEGSLDLLAVCRVVLIRKSSDALDLLTEAKLQRRFRGAEKSLQRLYAGYYVAEMLRLLTDNHDPHPALYDAAIDALGQIDGTGNPAATLLGFEAAALRLLGHAPTTRQCADCGNTVPRDRRMPFAPIAGGVVCPQCRSRQVSIVNVAVATVEQLEQLLAPHTRQPVTVSASVYAELRGLLNRYIQAILGTMPRMQPFLPARMEPDA